MTISELIKEGSIELEYVSSNMAALESEILLAHSLGISRESLFLDLDMEVDSSSFFKLLKKRKENCPIAYITGKKEFYGRDFLVDERVLIPRPDTETLVESVLAYTENYSNEQINIVDIGTGSGIIAITLASELENANILAVDISEKALEVAQKNAKLHGVAGHIDFVKSDMFFDLEFYGAHIIVSNLPYVPDSEKKEMSKDVINYEPSEALFSGSDGLKHYKKMFAGIKEKNIAFDAIFIEIFHTQFDLISEFIFSTLGLVKVKCIKDLAGKNRVVVVSK